MNAINRRTKRKQQRDRLDIRRQTDGKIKGNKETDKHKAKHGRTNISQLIVRQSQGNIGQTNRSQRLVNGHKATHGHTDRSQQMVRRTQGNIQTYTQKITNGQTNTRQQTDIQN